jgi:Zn-dependent M28 family amino/carboxypeptidase
LDSSDLNLKTTTQLVQELSSDTMDGRCPGTKGFEKAAFYVENYMKALEIKPFISGSYHDSLKVKDAVSFNLVGVIESKKPVNDYIVLSAHLDHLKKGDLKNMTDSIYNGANDNASGVVAVLQIAKELNIFKFDKNIIVALFTGEESGLAGSRHLAKRLKRNKINISYVVNIDMIGTPLTVSANSVYTTGFYLSDFAEVSNALLGEEFILHADRIYDQLDFMSSDNYPFFEEYHIPTSTIITYDKENYPYYHTVKDEFSKLNIQNMDLLITKVSRLLVLLLRKNSIITLKEPNLQPIDLLKNLPATK